MFTLQLDALPSRGKNKSLLLYIFRPFITKGLAPRKDRWILRYSLNSHRDASPFTSFIYCLLSSKSRVFMGFAKVVWLQCDNCVMVAFTCYELITDKRQEKLSKCGFTAKLCIQCVALLIYIFFYEIRVNCHKNHASHGYLLLFCYFLC